MTDEKGPMASASIPNQIVQILYVCSDRQGAHAATALKRLEHMPPLAQLTRERSNVSRRGRPAMQNDQ